MNRIAGRQLANQIREVVLEDRLRSLVIEPNSDVLGWHSQVLNEDVFHRSCISLGKLDRADTMLLISFDSDQDGVCRFH